MFRPKIKIHPWAYFWPGLPQLWVRGSWVGLAVAVGFITLGNTLLLAVSVFHAWLATRTVLLGSGVLVVVWLASWWHGRSWRQSAWGEADGEFWGDGGQSDVATPADTHTTDTAQGAAEQRDQLFREAQTTYLQHDWVRTEQLLWRLLKQDSRDVESRLLLATLWSHQSRCAGALRQLDRLEKLEAAGEWKVEIDALRQHLISQEKTTSSAGEETIPAVGTRVPADQIASIPAKPDRRQAA